MAVESQSLFGPEVIRPPVRTLRMLDRAPVRSRQFRHRHETYPAEVRFSFYLR